MKLKMKSDLQDVENTTRLIRMECDSLGIQQLDMIELALAEALNNVIIHAHKDHPELDITIQITKNSDSVEFNVIDSMNQLNSLKLEENPLDPNKNFVLATSGRGLDIIKIVMDEVSYISGILKMVKKLDQKEAQH